MKSEIHLKLKNGIRLRNRIFIWPVMASVKFRLLLRYKYLRVPYKSNRFHRYYQAGG